MKDILIIIILVFFLSATLAIVWRASVNMSKRVGNPFKINIFQLVDVDGEEIMLIRTILKFEYVQELFQKWYHGEWDYPNQFIEEMQRQGHDIERVYVDDIINP